MGHSWIPKALREGIKSTEWLGLTCPPGTGRRFFSYLKSNIKLELKSQEKEAYVKEVKGAKKWSEHRGDKQEAARELRTADYAEQKCGHWTLQSHSQYPTKSPITPSVHASFLNLLQPWQQGAHLYSAIGKWWVPVCMFHMTCTKRSSSLKKKTSM